MSEEKSKSRINLEDLPQDPQELTDEEAKNVQGGLVILPVIAGAKEGDGSVKPESNFGDTPGLNGGDMVQKMSRG